MIEVSCFPSGPIQTNAYLIRDGKDALVVDPGAPDSELHAALEGLTLHAVVFTHGHYDHIGGAEEFINQGIPLYVGEADADCLTDPARNLSRFASGPFSLSRKADHVLREGDVLEAGSLRFSVLFLPGHSRGSIGLYTDGHLFAGDVLFQGSIGRTDLPGGDMDLLASSIKTKIYSLPESTVVYPGHGPKTTVGEEKQGNPLIRG